METFFMELEEHHIWKEGPNLISRILSIVRFNLWDFQQELGWHGWLIRILLKRIIDELIQIGKV